ncbi:MAG: P-loop NTPase [Dehalococcoidia bacterium]
MEQVRHKIAIMSGKGGVGKSVITANLACLLADHGYRVGVLDADFSGPSLAKMLGVQGQRLKIGPAGVVPATGILGLRVMSLDFLLPKEESPVIWNGPAENTIVWQGAMEASTLRELLSDTDWGGLDFLLLDLPPGTERLSTVAQLLPNLSGAMIVTIPSEISYFVVKKSATLAKELNMTVLGLVENMAGYHCLNCGIVGQLFGTTYRGEETARSLGVPFLGQIPFDPRLAEYTDRGKPFILEHRDSIVATALRDIVKTIELALEEATK